MPRKPVLPANLRRKIKKGENAIEARLTAFIELCKYYNLDAGRFDHEDPSPWRELCEAMMNHLVPAFKVNNSGNTIKHSLSSDLEVLADLRWYMDFKKILPRNLRKNRKRLVDEASKKFACTAGQVEKAIDRLQELLRENPVAYYSPDLADFVPKYVTTLPAENRYTTRKRNISTK